MTLKWGVNEISTGINIDNVLLRSCFFQTLHCNYDGQSVLMFWCDCARWAGSNAIWCQAEERGNQITGPEQDAWELTREDTWALLHEDSQGEQILLKGSYEYCVLLLQLCNWSNLKRWKPFFFLYILHMSHTNNKKVHPVHVFKVVKTKWRLCNHWFPFVCF